MPGKGVDPEQYIARVAFEQALGGETNRIVIDDFSAIDAQRIAGQSDTGAECRLATSLPPSATAAARVSR